MTGYRTWKYLVVTLYPNEDDFPRVFFVRASCKSEVDHYVKKRFGSNYKIVDKYNLFLGVLMKYPEIPLDKF